MEGALHRLHQSVRIQAFARLTSLRELRRHTNIQCERADHCLARRRRARGVAVLRREASWNACFRALFVRLRVGCGIRVRRQQRYGELDAKAELYRSRVGWVRWVSQLNLEAVSQRNLTRIRSLGSRWVNHSCGLAWTAWLDLLEARRDNLATITRVCHMLKCRELVISTEAWREWHLARRRIFSTAQEVQRRRASRV